jgi:hypothetical protein
MFEVRCGIVVSGLMLVTALAMTASGGQSTGTPAASTESLFKEFKGARLGMPSSEVRRLLGKPEEKDAAQEFYVLSEVRRIRVYYDSEGQVSALVASFIGKDSGAPSPEAILGEPIAPGANGAANGSSFRPEDGYRVSYSRTADESPMVFITIQKLR